jgi:hypothetical protein
VARESRRKGEGRGGAFGQLTWGIASAVRMRNEPGLGQEAVVQVD